MGADIGTDSVTALVADLVGTIVGRRRMPVAPEIDAAERLKSARRVVRDALGSAAAPSTAVVAAAVATTGIVSADGRVITAPPPGWSGLDLATEVRKFIPAPVSVHNDIRLGALAERWRGAAQDANDVLYVQAGRAMGTALLIDGQPHVGFHDAAGELSFGGAWRWADAYDRFLTVGAEQPPHQNPNRDPNDLLAAAAHGEARARRAVYALSRSLAEGIETLVAALDPEVVIIGGSLSQAGEAVAEPVRQHLKAHCLFQSKVAVSTVGEDSVAVGAVRAALDNFETLLYSEGFAPDAPSRDPDRHDRARAGTTSNPAGFEAADRSRVSPNS